MEGKPARAMTQKQNKSQVQTINSAQYGLVIIFIHELVAGRNH